MCALSGIRRENVSVSYQYIIESKKAKLCIPFEVELCVRAVVSVNRPEIALHRRVLDRILLYLRLGIPFHISQSIWKQRTDVLHLRVTQCESAQIEANYTRSRIAGKEHPRRVTCVKSNFANSFDP